MDLFIEASGAPIIEDLINKAKFGARITFVAASKTPATLDFTQIMAKQLDVLGSQMYSNDFSAPLSIMQNMDLTPMISHNSNLGIQWGNPDCFRQLIRCQSNDWDALSDKSYVQPNC